MNDERTTLRQYVKAVLRYWWAVVTGLVLTLVDGAERIFGTWYLPPRWAKIATAVGGLAVAQYLAYRELARNQADKSSPESEFSQRLREAYRKAELQWVPVRVPTARVAPEVVSKQVDSFAEALADLYSRCPPKFDCQPLTDAVAELAATKVHRFGNRIGSQRELDLVCALMEAALEKVGALANEKPS